MEYVYKDEDFHLSINMTNRNPYEEKTRNDLFTIWAEAENIPLRRRPFPWLQITFQDSELDSFVYRNRLELGAVTKDSLFNFLKRPFPKILFPQDLQTHRINMQQTMHNLFHNINADTPTNPLQCFVFEQN